MDLTLKEDRPKLIVSRRAIAAGIASLIGAPAAAAATIGKLSNVPLTFDPNDFADMMRDGLFLPDYRQPMCRLVYDNGMTTRWMRYSCAKPVTGPRAGATAIAIETCAPDRNGTPRYTQLAIG